MFQEAYLTLRNSGHETMTLSSPFWPPFQNDTRLLAVKKERDGHWSRILGTFAPLVPRASCLPDCTTGLSHGSHLAKEESKRRNWYRKEETDVQPLSVVHLRCFPTSIRGKFNYNIILIIDFFLPSLHVCYSLFSFIPLKLSHTSFQSLPPIQLKVYRILPCFGVGFILL